MLNAANWTARLNELATDANVPGAALGIWSDGQEILAAHGVLNAATEVPVTTDSVFQVGSITKLWTATMGTPSASRPNGAPYLYMSGRMAPRVG